MFTRKNALISLAVVAFLAGCGGGGDSGSPAPNTNAAGGGNGGTASSDQKFADTMVLVNDQVAGTSNTQVMGLGYNNYTSTDPAVNAEYGNPSYGILGVYKGTSAPITTFGYRLVFNGTGTNGACTPGSKIGRIGFELKDQAGAAEQKDLQVMIDKVTIAEAADCSFTVSQDATSKVYVYAKNAAGQTGNGSATAPAGVVTVAPSNDGAGGSYLLLNVDAAVGAAKAAATGTNASVLGSVVTFTSGETKPFESSMTISNVNMTRADGTTKLAGKAITVNNSGVAGIADGGGVPLGHIQVVQ